MFLAAAEFSLPLLKVLKAPLGVAEVGGTGGAALGGAATVLEPKK